ncbi:MAG: hypothetical protein Q9213_004362 [Squamulea squamosa]
MASSGLPTRLIYCVDGTYCTPDGTHPRGRGNISNVYRIYASVKKGYCVNDDKKEFNQEKVYEPGLGSADNLNLLEKAKAGASGKGYKEIIRRVYKKCCTLNDTDEVWLYGFSRGAYIVRAVAGLLHHIGALQSVEKDFDSVYPQALKRYVRADNRSELGLGQFVGVFDTVKALDDAETHDISFNRSTQHFRHALALNEDRLLMKPNYEFPDFSGTKTGLLKRSFIQAWFVGAHMDMGGSSERDGLALYPFQWMLVESQSQGLVLEFEQLKAPWSGIDNPLRVVFPVSEKEGKGRDIETFTTKNGICVHMQDLRKVHKLPDYQGRYSIKINTRTQFYWKRQAREIFSAGEELRGYCGWAPQGTIIHPSVYLCLEHFVIQTLSLSKMPDEHKIERWRSKMLGTRHHMSNQGSWNDDDAELLDNDNLKTIRILVCGNTGVGKSTLINRVFGVDPSEEEVSKISDRKAGRHDVRDEIRHKGRRDLIIHDSKGFEYGDESQMREIGQFVKERSTMPNIEDRLHVIWFCFEMNSNRTTQTATESFLKVASEYTAEVPVIVIATKMDEFRGIQREAAREKFEPTTYEPSPEEMVELYRKSTKYAQDEIIKRMDMIEKELGSLEVGRFDACVAVARSDPKSIENLSRITSENVKDEKLQLLYIGTQTASVNLKIDAAVKEVMKIYTRVLGTASASGIMPTASSANRAGSAITVCRAIVQCFGLPTVNTQTILEIMKSTVWDDAGHNVMIAFSEVIATAGVFASVGFFGAPFFLVAGALNFPLVVPATTRLMLMLASDLILILVRAFRSTTTTCVGQPEEKDVALAAREYRAISADVHKEIFKLVPRRNVVKSFRYSKVRLGLKEIIERFKDEVVKDLSLDQSGRAGRKSSAGDQTAIDNEVEDFRKLFSVLRAKVNNKGEQVQETRKLLSDMKTDEGEKIQETIVEKLSLEDSDSGDESDGMTLTEDTR